MNYYIIKIFTRFICAGGRKFLIRLQYIQREKKMTFIWFDRLDAFPNRTLL